MLWTCYLRHSHWVPVSQCDKSKLELQDTRTYVLCQRLALGFYYSARRRLRWDVDAHVIFSFDLGVPQLGSDGLDAFEVNKT